MNLLRELFQKNSSTLLIMGLLVAVPLLGSSTLTAFLLQHRAWLEHLSVGGYALYFLVLAFTMAFALTNSTFAVIVTGYFLGWAGLLPTILSYGLAAALGYELAGRLDQGKLLAVLGRLPKVGPLLEELRHQSWSLIFLTRLSPVTPFALMTFVLAVMHVPRRRFLVASVIGMLPRSLFFYWLGTQAADVLALLRDPNGGTVSKLVMAGLVMASLGGLYVVFNSALQRALNRRVAQKNEG